MEIGLRLKIAVRGAAGQLIMANGAEGESKVAVGMSHP